MTALRRWTLLLFLALGLSWGTASAERLALVLDVEGAIGPATSDFVKRGLTTASERGASLVILRMDTPGGLDLAMRDIIKAILNSSIPVVTYVSPGGARAASAGTYILYASHVAAMSPATNLGSATPIQIGGMPGTPSEPPSTPGETPEEGDAPAKPEPSAMEKKVVNDAVAYIRGLANRYDRNADWAEQAVREAVSLTAEAALEKNVIDVVATDLGDLLEQIDGRTVRLATGDVTLDTEGLTIERLEPDWRSRLLSVITDPNIAYILMLIGIYGLIFELANPVAGIPGVIGAISLVLALYAFQVLPINYAGLGLILLGVLFMIGEALVPSFGALGLGGVVAFVAGSVILLDAENMAISLPLIGGTALVSAAFFIWIIGRFVGLRRKKVVTGAEELVGSEGVASEDFEHQGRVRVHSESWQAEAEQPVTQGQRIRVTGIQGLHLLVEPISEESE